MTCAICGKSLSTVLRAWDDALLCEACAEPSVPVSAVEGMTVAAARALLAWTPAAPRVPDTPQGCDHKALLQQTADALWNLQHEPDCWCAYSGGSGPTGHTEACAQARVVNEQLKAAGVQHWPPQEPPR